MLRFRKYEEFAMIGSAFKYLDERHSGKYKEWVI